MPRCINRGKGTNLFGKVTVINSRSIRYSIRHTIFGALGQSRARAAHMKFPGEDYVLRARRAIAAIAIRVTECVRHNGTDDDYHTKETPIDSQFSGIAHMSFKRSIPEKAECNGRWKRKMEKKSRVCKKTMQ